LKIGTALCQALCSNVRKVQKFGFIFGGVFHKALGRPGTADPAWNVVSLRIPLYGMMQRRITLTEEQLLQA